MRGLADQKFRDHFNQVLKLDWTDFDLWAVGGIVSDWETYDIDCVIFGPYYENRLCYLMNEMKKLGPWSPYWTCHSHALITEHTHRTKILASIPDNLNKYKLQHMWIKLPTYKQSVRKTKGILNGAPVQLIQNGSQVYF